MEVLFVADQIVPPIVNGSATVYRSWLEILARRHRVTAILFRSEGDDTAEAEAFLGRVCDDHLILPGVPASPAWKMARAMLRCANGSLFAPRFLEEWRRGPIQKSILNFTSRRRYDLALISKLNSVPLLGERVLASLGGVRLLDLHDDFVRREEIERLVLPDLLERYPVLHSYRPYRHLRIRQRLSRLVARRARAQERRLFRKFDTVLVSPGEVYYGEDERATATVSPISWPFPIPQLPADRSRASFDAGFIASDAAFNVQGMAFFLQQVLPRILQQKPDFTMLVVGRVAQPLRAILADPPGLTLVDQVDEVREFYEQVKLVVVPLLAGTGVSLKTLEALSFGCPIVSTAVGGRGLAVRSGRDLVIADDAAAMARSVLDLLADPNRQELLGRQGRERVATVHSADAVLDRLEAIMRAGTDRAGRTDRASRRPAGKATRARDRGGAAGGAAAAVFQTGERRAHRMTKR